MLEKATVGKFSAQYSEDADAVVIVGEHEDGVVYELATVAAEDVRDLVALLALINPYDNPTLLSTTAAIEEAFDVSKSTIRSWIKDGRVPGVFKVAKTAQVDLTIVEDVTADMVNKPSVGNPNFGSAFSKRIAKQRREASEAIRRDEPEVEPA